MGLQPLELESAEELLKGNNIYSRTSKGSN